MMEILELALKYGGFTSLDKVYLSQLLGNLTPEQQRIFITPPPSVINAYFAEMYQKQSPQAATEYYFSLSKELQLFQDQPSFAEEKPFVRLNLSGKSFGFAYIDDSGLAQVFSEKPEAITASLLFEIAQIFPHYLIFDKEGKIYMEEKSLPEENWQELMQEEFPLTQLEKNGNWLRISGYNDEEVRLAASPYQGQIFYAWSGRKAILYIHQQEKM